MILWGSIMMIEMMSQEYNSSFVRHISIFVFFVQSVAIVIRMQLAGWVRWIFKWEKNHINKKKKREREFSLPWIHSLWKFTCLEHITIKNFKVICWMLIECDFLKLKLFKLIRRKPAWWLSHKIVKHLYRSLSFANLIVLFVCLANVVRNQIEINFVAAA